MWQRPDPRPRSIVLIPALAMALAASPAALASSVGSFSKPSSQTVDTGREIAPEGAGVSQTSDPLQFAMPKYAWPISGDFETTNQTTRVALRVDEGWGNVESVNYVFERPVGFDGSMARQVPIREAYYGDPLGIGDEAWYFYADINMGGLETVGVQAVVNLKRSSGVKGRLWSFFDDKRKVRLVAAPPPPVDDPPAEEGADELILKAGNGFSGSTNEPGPVGDPNARGYSAKAIAHWDVVPDQMFQGDFHVGVIAFHIAGIDRVEFRLDGGQAANSTEMTLNPRTDVWEYTAVIPGDDLPDGPLELRAIAYPKHGKPRLLETLRVYNNSDGRLPSGVKYVSVSGNDGTGDGSRSKPYRSIWKAAYELEQEAGYPYYAGGGTVYLLEGDHRFAQRPSGGRVVRTGGTWMTISGAPGTSRSKVRIVGNGGGDLRSTHNRFANLTIYETDLATNPNSGSRAWFDNCLLQGANENSTKYFASYTRWKAGIYLTDTTIRTVKNGTTWAKIARGCTLEDIQSDAFHNPRLVVNCKVDGLKKPGGSGYHPDLVQFNGNFDNVIVYGVQTKNVHAQGIFSRTVTSDLPDRNIAFVNFHADTYTYRCQWMRSVDHLLLWNVSIDNADMHFRHNTNGDRTVVTNLSVRDSVFQVFQADGGIVDRADGFTFHNNHYETGDAFGVSWTRGTLDGTLVAGDSVLGGRVAKPLVPADAKGNPRTTPAAIGAYEPVAR